MTDPAAKQAIALVPAQPKREIITVTDPVAALDTAKFEQMQRIATVMANSTLIPESLYMEGKGNDKKTLPMGVVVANCFLIVNQSVRWNMDPFAVAQCTSVIHGKLCYEGKLVAAVIDAKLDKKLFHYFIGDATKDEYRIFLSDKPFTKELIEKLKPGFRNDDAGSFSDFRLWDGSVAEWKTTGNNSPWGAVKNYTRMLIYRGTRDWTRIYESAIMLGVYTDDELLDLVDDVRARRAIPTSSGIAARLGAPASGESLTELVERETAKPEAAQPGEQVKVEAKSEIQESGAQAPVGEGNTDGQDTTEKSEGSGSDQPSTGSEAATGSSPPKPDQRGSDALASAAETNITITNPKNAAEYALYSGTHIKAEKDAKALGDWWKSADEAALRKSCKVSNDQSQAIKQLVLQRIDALKQAGE